MGGFWTLGGVTTRDPSLYERALRHRRTVAATGNFSPLTALVSHRHLTCEMGVKVSHPAMRAAHRVCCALGMFSPTHQAVGNTPQRSRVMSRFGDCPDLSTEWVSAVGARGDSSRALVRVAESSQRAENNSSLELFEGHARPRTGRTVRALKTMVHARFRASLPRGPR